MNYKKIIWIFLGSLFFFPAFGFEKEYIENFYYNHTIETIAKYRDEHHTTLWYLYIYKKILTETKRDEEHTEKLFALETLLEINEKNIENQLKILDTSKNNIEVFVKYFETKNKDYLPFLTDIKNAQIINTRNENGENFFRTLLENGSYRDIDFALNRGLNPNNINFEWEIALYNFLKNGGKKHPKNFQNPALAGKINEPLTKAILKNMLFKWFQANLVDIHHKNLLFYTIDLGNDNIILDIIENYPLDFTLKNNEGNNIFFYAREKIRNNEIIKKILQKIDIDSFSGNKESIWHILVTKSTSLLQEWFLRNMKINTANQEWKTEMMVAIEYENDEATLIEKYSLIKNYSPIDLDQKDHEWNNLAFYAVKKGFLHFFELLLEDGIRTNILNHNGESLLIYALKENQNSEMIQKILSTNISIHTLDFTGNNALYYATTREKIDIIKMLLEMWGNINNLNLQKESPLSFVIKKNNIALFHLFLDYNMDLNLVMDTEKKQTILFLLISQKRNEMLKLYMAKYPNTININYSDIQKENALFYAIESSDYEIVLLLSSLWVYFDNLNHNNQTPLMHAAKRNNHNIFRIVFEKSSQHVQKDNQWKTALHYACEAKNYNAIDMLMKTGLQKELKDMNGKNCEDYLTIKK